MEELQRRLKRIEMVVIVAAQISVQSGKDPDYKRAWKIVKRWNTRRVKMGLSTYW